MAGLDPLESDTDAWATGANQALNALNDGFIPDQTLNNATGALTTNATFASGTTFTVVGDQTAFYVAKRRLKIVHAGGTTYCEVASSSYSAPNTTVTIGTITSGPATMTTPITGVAVAPVFAGTAGNTKAPAITTQGDLVYGGVAGAETRLPIGTAGKALLVNAGATAPEWATLSVAHSSLTGVTANDHHKRTEAKETADNSAASQSVTWTTAFSATPVVTVGAPHGPDPGGKWARDLYVESRSTTGATVKSMDGASDTWRAKYVIAQEAT